MSAVDFVDTGTVFLGLREGGIQAIQRTDQGFIALQHAVIIARDGDAVGRPQTPKRYLPFVLDELLQGISLRQAGSV